MLIRSARFSEMSELIAFFDRNLRGNAILEVMLEWGCPLGAKAAVNQNRILVAIDQGRVVAAVRFYRRKRDKRVSLYQFAVEPGYRHQGLTKRLLLTLDADVSAQCPRDSELNEFYKRSGWTLEVADQRFNYWILATANRAQAVHA
jgi:diaminopimelate decarboxylase